MTGVIYLSEGIQKYLFPEVRGSGRFESIGLPTYDFLGNGSHIPYRFFNVDWQHIPTDKRWRKMVIGSKII